MAFTTTDRVRDLHPILRARSEPQAVVMIVSDDLPWSQGIETVCDFFGLAVEMVPSDFDLWSLLEEFRPMAVITDVDGLGQDGFHVMRTVAEYDQNIPVMLLCGDDAALAGAAEAVQEICGLATLVALPELPGVGRLVDFLFTAGRKAGLGRMMPV